MNVAVVAPAATITVERGPADGLELASMITTPPAGAFPSSVTLAEPTTPPLIVVGLAVSAVSAGGFTITVTDFETPPQLAVMTTGVDTVTGFVAIAKLEEALAPAATVTLAGGMATAGLADVSVTTVPAAGAKPSSVTEPLVMALPPAIGDVEAENP